MEYAIAITGAIRVNIAKLSKRETESMNEAKLIELLKSENLTSTIKTKEYVDMDMLEKAIYAGDIPQDVLLKMESCKEVKTTVTLSVKKKKEKK